MSVDGRSFDDSVMLPAPFFGWKLRAGFTATDRFGGLWPWSSGRFGPSTKGVAGGFCLWIAPTAGRWA